MRQAPRSDCKESEVTLDFIAPPSFQDGLSKVKLRHAELSDIEREIDDEVYRLYGISHEDRQAIEQELAEQVLAEIDLGVNDESVLNENVSIAQVSHDLTENELAKQWISYSVGIVMGRFLPGIKDALGCGNYSGESSIRLLQLSDSDGVLVADKGHPKDFTARIAEALHILLGEEVVAEAIFKVTGRNGGYEESLGHYLEHSFFREHIQKYRKRPVYWYFQSPKKKYGVWAFHERLTKDSLFRIRSEYVQPKIRLLEGQIADIPKRANASEGKEKRRLEREMVPLHDTLDDVREFERRLKYISEGRDGTQGYTPHIDDGVLLNMAPLWELIPSWQAEPKKAWEELKAGKYDWSYQAMGYWPDRVREKCRANKSYAIAHGLLDLYEEHNRGPKK